MSPRTTRLASLSEHRQDPRLYTWLRMHACLRHDYTMRLYNFNDGHRHRRYHPATAEGSDEREGYRGLTRTKHVCKKGHYLTSEKRKSSSNNNSYESEMVQI